jgi:hypothetical protein
VLARHIEHRAFKIWSASSNWSGLESWLTSPVWRMKSGFTGMAAILATASRKVTRVSGLNGLEKPMWLSLICTKLKGRARVAAAAASSPTDAGTPPASVQTSPVPAQLMHFKNPRRLSPPCSLIETSNVQEA